MNNEQIEKAVLSEINPEMDQRKSAKQADHNQQAQPAVKTQSYSTVMPATDLKTENAKKAYLQKPNPEQLAHLKRCLDEAAKQQPEIISLRRRLLSLGGVELVAPPTTDPGLSLIIEHGRIKRGPIKCIPMSSSEGQKNIATYWMTDRVGVVGIGIGYALSDDGLWRQHFWGVRRRGILETTTKREQYFGVTICAAEAAVFAITYSR